jgi:hypothetical protein
MPLDAQHRSSGALRGFIAQHPLERSVSHDGQTTWNLKRLGRSVEDMTCHGKTTAIYEVCVMPLPVKEVYFISA